MAAGVIMTVSMGISALLNHVLVRRVHDDTLETITANPDWIVAAKTTQDALQEAAVAPTELATFLLSRSPLYVEQAALATTVAMVVGCLIAIGWLFQRYQALPPTGTTLRLLLSAAVLWGIDRLLVIPIEWTVEMGKIPFLAIVVGKMAVMGVAVLVVLIATREFGRDDLASFWKVIGRPKKSVN